MIYIMGMGYQRDNQLDMIVGLSEIGEMNQVVFLIGSMVYTSPKVLGASYFQTNPYSKHLRFPHFKTHQNYSKLELKVATHFLLHTWNMNYLWLWRI